MKRCSSLLCRRPVCLQLEKICVHKVHVLESIPRSHPSHRGGDVARGAARGPGRGHVEAAVDTRLFGGPRQKGLHDTHSHTNLSGTHICTHTTHTHTHKHTQHTHKHTQTHTSNKHTVANGHANPAVLGMRRPPHMTSTLKNRRLARTCTGCRRAAASRYARPMPLFFCRPG